MTIYWKLTLFILNEKDKIEDTVLTVYHVASQIRKNASAIKSDVIIEKFLLVKLINIIPVTLII